MRGKQYREDYHKEFCKDVVSTATYLRPACRRKVKKKKEQSLLKVQQIFKLLITAKVCEKVLVSYETEI